MMSTGKKSSALPKAWIVPIRLGIYAVLASCSAFIYFNVGDLVITQYLIIISIVVVSAMVLLDCRVSDTYWQKGSRSEDSQLKAEKNNLDDDGTN
jgi:hypothetical protein